MVRPALLFACVLLLTACEPQANVPTAAPPTPTATPMSTASIPFDPSPPPFMPHGETTQATVTKITDGDTIHVDINGTDYRVRYIGVDAPELAHDGKPAERLGPEATTANAALVEGQQVVLEKDVSETDYFGRLLRYVWLPPPTSADQWEMVDLELVEEGMADVKRYPPDTYWQATLQQAEDNAKAAQLGIWSAP